MHAELGPSGRRRRQNPALGRGSAFCTFPTACTAVASSMVRTRSGATATPKRPTKNGGLVGSLHQIPQIYENNQPLKQEAALVKTVKAAKKQ